ncbi:hypothetical protein B0T25DRAFT_496843 [Lasiosphaeria hispida]|uniref:Ketoreductase domain-containing protein n=1 Tax=Lasiosphaeria hispida TaxID=260671 RepID=A0AAJ0HK13_9PEZI|nr:hypothetical protein B0T25DRAFT_496843 [Lasiosphaeria hispida]
MATSPTTHLTGRVAIVTGGTRNIGGGISKELALRGAHVAMIYQNPATSAAAEAYARELESLGGGGRAVAILADLADVASPARIVKETLEKLKVEKIDIVVNNAAQGDWTATQDITLERYAAVMDTNVRAPIMLVQAVLPHMPTGGRIINISSFATRMVNIGPGIPPMPLYIASKIALEGLTQNWAVEFGQSHGITANAVSVGFVETDLIAAMSAEQKEQIREGNAWRVAAAPRPGTPDDVAQVVAFLASEGSRWVTGSTVSANGGTIII